MACRTSAAGAATTRWEGECGTNFSSTVSIGRGLEPVSSVPEMTESGTYKFGPSDGHLYLRVYKDGMAKAMGHDLVLEVTDWSAEAVVADDPTSSTLTAVAKTASIEIKEGTGGAKALSDKDRSDIKKNMEDKVFKAHKSGEITFRSSAVQASGENGHSVTGDLTIAGTTKPVTVDVTVAGSKATATVTIQQTAFGLKLFSAMMGALKVKDTVEIEAEVSLP